MRLESQRMLQGDCNNPDENLGVIKYISNENGKKRHISDRFNWQILENIVTIWRVRKVLCVVASTHRICNMYFWNGLICANSMWTFQFKLPYDQPSPSRGTDSCFGIEWGPLSINVWPVTALCKYSNLKLFKTLHCGWWLL